VFMLGEGDKLPTTNSRGIKIMNRQKITRSVFGITTICVILFGVMLHSALGRESAQAISASTDTGELFLPVVMKPLIFTTSRISVASDGTEGNSDSEAPSVSTDGRYVAFFSHANNLVSGDTNGSVDIFFHDRWTNQTSRVSVASDGTQGNDNSYWPSISGDGRYVAFSSDANNLVSDDTNSTRDVFVHDQLIGQTSRISVASDGTPGSHSSDYPSISADGRYVAFASLANNLVSDDTNYSRDIFVHDRQTGQTSRISVASDGSQGNGESGDYAGSTLSADGRYVAFYSRAGNLVSNDTNYRSDIFVHDRLTGLTSRVSVASDGTEGNDNSGSTAISADGRYVAFVSYANNLVNGDTNNIPDVFVHDRQIGLTNRISVASDGTQGDYGGSQKPSFSADGRYVAFSSASSLDSSDTNGMEDIFVHDQLTRQTRLLSVASDGSQGNLHSWQPSISANGHFVAFSSYASNLVSGDTNGWTDVFVRDRGE
jgi:Tol biopolymer transport system component